MNIEDFGYNNNVAVFIAQNGLNKSDIGRITAVFKDRYDVITNQGSQKAQITGNLQYSAESQFNMPAVGDWVHVQNFDNQVALITQVLPRINYIDRRAVGRTGEKQIIAANIDYGLIVDAVTENFNINRIERYITICNTSKVEPIILLTKIDLISAEELSAITSSVKARLDSLPVIYISNITNYGIEELKSFLIPKKTYCLLGLSGVGKSTLINKFSDKMLMKTNAISESTNKGVHTTSHRQLFLLDNESIIIDNPGMREVGLADATTAIGVTFDKISEIADSCRFSDCTHTHEKDCAVLEAVKTGVLEKAYINNYNKMKKEQFHLQATLLEKRKRDKTFGKMVKNVMKNKKSKRN